MTLKEARFFVAFFFVIVVVCSLFLFSDAEPLRLSSLPVPSALHPYHFLEAQALGVLFWELPHQPVFILLFSYCPCVPQLGCILPESKTGVSSFIPGA